MPAEPFVFLDRSLGRIVVPGLLRSAGISLITLAEHYGMPADEDVDDTTWIRDAAAQGWILFMKDEQIRRRPAERQALVENNARCFCLANGNLRADAMAGLYVAHWSQIVVAAAEPGPFLYSIRATGMVRVSID
jgi:hypothetical protein